jgi:hypothetical protein
LIGIKLTDQGIDLDATGEAQRGEIVPIGTLVVWTPTSRSARDLMRRLMVIRLARATICVSRMTR